MSHMKHRDFISGGKTTNVAAAAPFFRNEWVLRDAFAVVPFHWGIHFRMKIFFSLFSLFSVFQLNLYRIGWICETTFQRKKERSLNCWWDASRSIVVFSKIQNSSRWYSIISDEEDVLCTRMNSPSWVEKSINQTFFFRVVEWELKKIVRLALRFDSAKFIDFFSYIQILSSSLLQCVHSLRDTTMIGDGHTRS